MRYSLILILILITLGIGIYIQYLSEPAIRHIHAGFLVFENGIQKDFSAINYMSLMPCREADAEYSPEELQDRKAHLHDNVGNLVHSHRKGAFWKDLFKNMDYEIDPSEISGYINGKKVNNILNQPINEYDSAVFFIGPEDSGQLSKSMTREQIIKLEESSRDCSTDDTDN